MLSVHLTALKAASVEEVDDQKKVTVREVRQQDGDGALLTTSALAAGERSQQCLEVGRVREDKPVHRQRYPLSAVEDDVCPPLRPHVVTDIGDQQSQVMVLLY